MALGLTNDQQEVDAWNKAPVISLLSSKNAVLFQYKRSGFSSVALPWKAKQELQKRSSIWDGYIHNSWSH